MHTVNSFSRVWACKVAHAHPATSLPGENYHTELPVVHYQMENDISKKKKTIEKFKSCKGLQELR